MAKVAYTSAGFTIAEVETLVAQACGLDTSDATSLTKIDRAITDAGQTAATWNGAGWWWTQARSVFSPNVLSIAAAASSGARRTSNAVTLTLTATHGIITGQYVLVDCTDDTTVNGVHKVTDFNATNKTITYWSKGDDIAAATSGSGTVSVVSYPICHIDVAGQFASTNLVIPDAYSLQKLMFNDDWRLSKYRDVTGLLAYITAFTSDGEPTHYAISQEQYTDATPTVFNATTLFLLPPPNSADDKIWVNYLRAHSEITSAGSLDTALIVPPQFQRGVYVAGASWLLRNENLDVADLGNCPQFAKAMERMADADASDDYDIGDTMVYPATAHVTIFPTDGDDADYGL